MVLKYFILKVLLIKRIKLIVFPKILSKLKTNLFPNYGNYSDFGRCFVPHYSYLYWLRDQIAWQLACSTSTNLKVNNWVHTALWGWLDSYLIEKKWIYLRKSTLLDLMKHNTNHIILPCCHLQVSCRFQLTSVAPLGAVSDRFNYSYADILLQRAENACTVAHDQKS